MLKIAARCYSTESRKNVKHGNGARIIREVAISDLHNKFEEIILTLI